MYFDVLICLENFHKVFKSSIEVSFYSNVGVFIDQMDIETGWSAVLLNVVDL